jgi:outer membrane protein TolC
MIMGRRLLAALFMLGAAVVARGQNGTPPTTETADMRDVALLDDVPNYLEIFRTQWSSDVPPDVVAAENAADPYGRLVDGQPLQATSLADCIELALRNNTDLQIQRLGPLSAVAGVYRALGQFDPAFYGDILRDRSTVPTTTSLTGGIDPIRLTHNLNFDFGLRKQLLSGGLAELKWTNNRLVANPSFVQTLRPQYTTFLGFSLSQPLLRDFGWRYSLLVVEVAETEAESAYYDYRGRIASTITQVERAYWTLVAAIENVRVQEHGRELANELLRQNEGKFNVGALPQTAVLEARAEVARREANLIEAKNRLTISRDNLRVLVNARAPDAPAIINIDPQYRPEIESYHIDLERSLQTALRQRPELRAAQLNVRTSGLERKIAQNQLLPKLNVVGGVGMNGIGGEDAEAVTLGTVEPTPGMPVQIIVPVEPNQATLGGYKEALSQLYDGRFYQYHVGASFEIPLDNATAKAAYARANIDFERDRLSLRQLQENITLEIKTAVGNLETDLKSIEARRIARELAGENLRNQQARYDVGLATTKDLLDFQNLYTLAQLQEVQALTQYNSDLAELRRVEGTLLESHNVVVESATAVDRPWWARF